MITITVLSSSLFVSQNVDLIVIAYGRYRFILVLFGSANCLTVRRVCSQICATSFETFFSSRDSQMNLVQEITRPRRRIARKLASECVVGYRPI